jgi:Fe-S-cluster containining protein
MATKNREETDFFNTCAQCKTSCCQTARPPLTSRRRKIIDAYLKRQKIPLENPFIQTNYTFPREDKEGYCIFYDRETKKCHVHSVKPETCVAGPVTFDINMKTQKVEWHLKKETLCPLAGKLYYDKERLNVHLKLAKKEIRKLIKELDAEALRAILKIEEPETFKIDEDIAEKDVLGKLV